MTDESSLTVEQVLNWRDVGSHADYIRIGILPAEWRDLCNLALAALRSQPGADDAAQLRFILEDLASRMEYFADEGVRPDEWLLAEWSAKARKAAAVPPASAPEQPSVWSANDTDGERTEQPTCPFPVRGDDGTKSQCVEHGHCGCGAVERRLAQRRNFSNMLSTEFLMLTSHRRIRPDRRASQRAEQPQIGERRKAQRRVKVLPNEHPANQLRRATTFDRRKSQRPDVRGHLITGYDSAVQHATVDGVDQREAAANGSEQSHAVSAEENNAGSDTAQSASHLSAEIPGPTIFREPSMEGIVVNGCAYSPTTLIGALAIELHALRAKFERLAEELEGIKIVNAGHQRLATKYRERAESAESRLADAHTAQREAETAFAKEATARAIERDELNRTKERLAECERLLAETMYRGHVKTCICVWCETARTFLQRTGEKQ